ncbi:MAG: hypothetical protein RL011_654 [Pseudomonadota bacterium]
MKFRLIPLLVVPLVLISCRTLNKDAANLKIVGGQPVVETDEIVGHTVGLIWDEQNNRTNGCTGVLVGQRWVLTAAHCFKAAGKVEGLKVTFGTRRDRDPRLVISAQLFALFERISSPAPADMAAIQPQPEDDIALVKLESDAPTESAPAPIAGEDTDLNPEDLIVIAGFGSTQADNPDAGTLRKAVLPLSVVDKESLQLRFTEHARSVEFKGSCFGDSGGPAFVLKDGKLRVVGVASGGDYRCRERSVYTDVRSYKSWILSLISDI